MIRRFPNFGCALLLFLTAFVWTPVPLAWGASPNQDCPTYLLAESVQALSSLSWVDAKFSIPFLHELQPLSDERLLSDYRIDPDRLHGAARKFSHHRGGQPPLQTSHHLAERTKGSERYPVVLFVMRVEKNVVGFLAVSFRPEPNALDAWSEYLKVDPRRPETSGIARSFFSFTRGFYAAMGVRSERLEAGWAGRPIWARMGYDFDPAVSLLEDNQPFSQLELTRRNFGRFLSMFRINVRDLYLEKELGGREPIAPGFQNLHTPEDFLSVYHVRGPSILVAPYVDADTLGERTLEHPGKAFSLWDYRPRLGQTIAITLDGKPLSDIAMPTWIGIFRFEN